MRIARDYTLCLVTILSIALSGCDQNEVKEEAKEKTKVPVPKELYEISPTTSTKEHYEASLSAFLKEEYPSLLKDKNWKALQRNFNTHQPNSERLVRLQVSEKLQKKLSDAYKEYADAVVAQKKAERDRFDAFKEKVAEKLLSAEKVEELDPLFIELEGFGKLDQYLFSSYHMGTHPQTSISQEVRSLTSLVNYWQDYLHSMSQGDKSAAESKLNSISQVLTTLPIIPRSKVLHLSSSEQDGDTSSIKTESSVYYQIMKELRSYTTLASLDQAEEVYMKRLESENPSMQRYAKQILKEIAEVRSLIILIDQGEDPKVFEKIRGVSSGFGGWSLQLKSLLRKRAFQVVSPIALPDDVRSLSAVKQLHYAASKLQKEERFDELVIMLDLARSSYSYHYDWIENDIQGIEYYLAAEKLREKGLPRDAYHKYVSALSQVGKYIPDKLISTRLEALKGEMKTK